MNRSATKLYICILQLVFAKGRYAGKWYNLGPAELANRVFDVLVLRNNEAQIFLTTSNSMNS